MIIKYIIRINFFFSNVATRKVKILYETHNVSIGQHCSKMLQNKL